MIAKPEDDRDRRQRGDLSAIDAELHRIETADGKLDRHVEPVFTDPIPFVLLFRPPSLDRTPRPSWFARLLARLRVIKT